MIEIQKDVFRHVESLLYRYPQIKKEISRLRESLLYPYQDDENVGGGKSNIPGDPTSSTAIKLAEHAKLVHLERVRDAIEQVYNVLPEPKQELIRVKYWTSPQRLTTIGICDEIGISESTFRRWRKQTLQDIAELLGWG